MTSVHLVGSRMLQCAEKTYMTRVYRYPKKNGGLFIPLKLFSIQATILSVMAIRLRRFWPNSDKSCRWHYFLGMSSDV